MNLTDATPAGGILEAVIALAKLGSGSLDFWKTLHEISGSQLDKVKAHDAELKPAPEPGPKKE